jgi:hypothetical protein
VGRSRKLNLSIYSVEYTIEDETLSHLRYAIARCVKQGVRAPVAKTFQSFTNLLAEIMPSEIEYVRHILHEERERSEHLYIFQIGKVKLSPWVMAISFGMLVNLPQLSASDASKRGARRPSDEDVNRGSGIGNAEFAQQ